MDISYKGLQASVEFITEYKAGIIELIEKYNDTKPKDFEKRVEVLRFVLKNIDKPKHILFLDDNGDIKYADIKSRSLGNINRICMMKLLPKQNISTQSIDKVLDVISILNCRVYLFEVLDRAKGIFDNELYGES